MYKPKDIISYTSKYDKYQLSNGITVLLVESHKSPVISVQAWVHTGSRNETKESQKGITHFIEHLLFKTTENFKVGEIASLVEGAGGQLNAYTTYDHTVFYITIASQYTSIAFKALSQMIVFPTFESQSIDDEREVVIEEMKRSKDSPHHQSSDLIFSTMYQGHPYSYPILGYEKNIRNLTPDQIAHYYRTHYHPTNITLVIAGDFKASIIKHIIEKYFKPLKKQKPLPLKQDSFHEPKHVSTLKAPFEETHIHLAWRLSPDFNKDLPALDALSVILGQGHSSRLYNQLRIQNLYVNNVSCYTYTLLSSGLFVISCMLPEDKIHPTLDILAKELLSLLTQRVDLKELQKAKTLIESEEYYEMETVDGLSEKYGYYESMYGDPDYSKTYLDKLQSLRSQDLIHAAQAYLSVKDFSLCVMTKDPDKHKTKLEKWFKHYQDHICSKFLAKSNKQQPQKSGVQKVQYTSGVRLYMYPSSQTPTVSLDIGFDGGGLVAVPCGLMGIAELTKRVWPTATKDHTEVSLKSKLDQLASFLHGFTGRNSMGLSLTTLSSSLNETITLLKDVLQRPLFLKDIIAREKVAMLKKLEKRKDDPFRIAMRLFEQTLFQDHPYGIDPLGHADSLDKISQEDIISYWKKVLNPQHQVISVVGDFDPLWMKEKFAEILEAIPRSDTDILHPVFKPLSEPQEVFHQMKDKAQRSIVLGYKGLTLQDPRRFALEVLESILSGQSGRLFLHLRDQASLAYTVSPISLTGKDGGFFATYIACQPDKTKQAVDMIRSELQKLCNELVSSEELERAKQYLIGHHNIALQKNSALSAAIFSREIYGLSYKEIFNYAQEIKKITAEQILELSQNLFKQQPDVLITCGP